MSSIGFDEDSLILGELAESAHVDQRARVANQFETVLTCCEVIADALTVMFAAALSYFLYHGLGLGRHVIYSSGTVFVAATVFAGLQVLLLDREGAYRLGSSLLRIRETERVLRASVIGFLLVSPVPSLTGHLVSRWVIILAFFFVPALLIVQKHTMYLIVCALHNRGYGIRRVLIYGAGYTGRRVFSALARSTKLGLEPVIVLDDDPGKCGEEVFDLSYSHERCLTISRGPLTRKLLDRNLIDMVIVAIPSLDRERFLTACAEAAATGASLAFVPGQSVPSDYQLDYTEIDGLLLGSFGKPPAKLRHRLLKRAFDLVVSTTVLLLSLPVSALVALLVKLDSPGPALFVQTRVGQNGKTFNMYKFRTMYTDAPKYHYSPTDGSDMRITRLGRFLRRTSFDEVPQILNVIRGDMSLVGPRPEMPFIVAEYNARQRQRLEVKPGVTGLWQLSADRAHLIHENIHYDLYYIRNQNFFMDLAILLHTAAFAMRGI
ncbi:MAG TPA: sugar transferase [Terriglobales bacterium]|nr:sugar transferase [Terriglobales bacterium]